MQQPYGWFREHKRRFGQAETSYGKKLAPNQPLSVEGVSAGQIQVCHRFLRRVTKSDSLVGPPCVRTIMGVKFTTACDHNRHAVETDEWTLSYCAVNSREGWRYGVLGFKGDLAAFSRDILLVRSIR